MCRDQKIFRCSQWSPAASDSSPVVFLTGIPRLMCRHPIPEGVAATKGKFYLTVCEHLWSIAGNHVTFGLDRSKQSKRMMRSFLANASEQVTLSNWRQAPYCHWAFHHVRAIVPTAAIQN